MRQSNRPHTGREPALSGGDRPQGSGQEPRVGGDRALLHLVEMLQHHEPHVRTRAALSLAEVGDERALTHLLAIMQDGSEYWDIRERAAYALGPIGRAAVPRLLSMLYVDWNIYSENLAAIGLGAVARHHPHLVDDIAPALIKALGDSGLSTRVAVVRSMGRVGDPAFIPHLLDVLRAERGRLGVCTAEALGMFGEKARLPEVVDALFDCLLDERTEHGMVSPFAEALAGIGDPQTIPHALKLIEQGQWRVANVIDQLVEGFGETATPYLLDSLQRINNRYRPPVIEALGSTRDRRAVEALLDMLDDGAEHKSSIIGALGMLRDPQAAPRLVELLYVPAEPYIITKIMWALDLIGDSAVAPVLLSYLDDHTTGSLIAIRMLGEFKYAPAVPYLIGRLSNRIAHADVIIALARIGTPEALSALARLVSPEELVGLPENLDPAILDAIEALRTNPQPD